MKKLLLLCSLLLQYTCCLFAENHWRTHFSYNSVQQIALDNNEVYALANGKMFSINQQTEQLTLFTNFSGLHGIDIVQIAYDNLHEQLLILYADGKMDIMRNGRIHYIPDLYNKQITLSKKCNNITFLDKMAYLSMDFGILTFDLEEYEFVDTYYIAPAAKEVQVTDVMFYGDSIYAQTPKVIYAAHTEDDIVDFRYWHACQVPPTPFDTTKGQEYISRKGDVWKVADTKGVARELISGEQVFYLPDGPCVNTAHRLEVVNGKLYAVPGGRWTTQNNTPGNVMIYENNKWTNITNSYIEKQTSKKARDFMDVAIDPTNPSRFFVTSFGTGLYEFRDTTFYAHYTTNNSILSSAAPSDPDGYTRLESAVFDKENKLWVCVNGDVDTTLVCFLPDGSQRGVNFYTDSTTRFIFHTSSSLVIDATNSQRKWLVSCRSTAAVAQLDDGGTPFNAQDDQCKVRTEFYDQDGSLIAPKYYYTLSQAPNGDIWIGSVYGPIIIPTDINFLQSNQCRRLRIDMPDGTNFLDTERVNAFAWDDEENIWIGTQTGGVYVLNPEGTEILAHYTSDNSEMPSNTVLSLAYDSNNQQMFIGTARGIVSYIENPNTSSNTDISDDEITYGRMYKWRSHSAYTQIKEVVVMGDKVYALSSNSLFSVNKKDREIEYYTKLDGLSSSIINHIAYNQQLNRMLITYQNGQLDIMDSNGKIYNISDLFLKQMSISKQVNDICMYQDKAILGMNFGLLVIDMKKIEISDTYYIGENSSEVNVNYITLTEDNIYAATDKQLYYANLSGNLMDYAYWTIIDMPNRYTPIHSMCTYNDIVYILQDKKLYQLKGNLWEIIESPYALRDLCVSKNNFLALPDNRLGVCKIHDNLSITEYITYGYNYAIQEDGNAYWLGTRDNGLVRLQITSTPSHPYDIQENYPDGPLNNFSYRLRFFGDKLYMLAGGRWTTEYERPGDIMIYENDTWRNIKNEDLIPQTNHALSDMMNVAQDPNDPSHYFVTTYGTGLLEMYNDQVKKLYLPSNSNLFSAAPDNPDKYTRTDGAMYDDKGNLWVLNMGSGNGNVHVISPDGKWHSFDLEQKGSRIVLQTTGEILVDNRNSQWKWIPLLRATAGLVLLQDNGTPTNPKDDKVTYRQEWIDQNAQPIIPNNIYAIAQDHTNTIWVGTSSGIFAIPASVDFSNSNLCKRVVIPRNDGSGLGDYLLDNEQINAIAIDGANRLWVGTATSGIYLLNPIGSIDDVSYTVETVAHFTTDNSIMPTDEVLSIAIQESTGEVFIGTGGGLVSYMSDATKSEETFDNLYAFPNPVHPTYQGYITIKGMMENSEVRIVDTGGNLVKTLQSTGGSAVWDGTNANGQRVVSGVYTALCNTITDKGHGEVKILIMN